MRQLFGYMVMALLFGIEFSPNASAAVVLSNLERSSNGSFILYSGQPRLGQAFTTGATLSGVTAISLNLRPFQSDGGFSVSVFSDGDGVPDALVATLSGESNPVQTAVYRYTPDNPEARLVLSPDTTYWVVASISVSTSNYGWRTTESSNFVSSGSWSMPLAIVQGSPTEWYPFASMAFKMSIEATAVQEPASFCLILVGVGIVCAGVAGSHTRRFASKAPAAPPER